MVCVEDFEAFKASVANMPEQLPPVEADQSWQPILEKNMDAMKYSAWRRALPVCARR